MKMKKSVIESMREMEVSSYKYAGLIILGEDEDNPVMVEETYETMSQTYYMCSSEEYGKIELYCYNGFTCVLEYYGVIEKIALQEYIPTEGRLEYTSFKLQRGRTVKYAWQEFTTIIHCDFDFYIAMHDHSSLMEFSLPYRDRSIQSNFVNSETVRLILGAYQRGKMPSNMNLLNWEYDVGSRQFKFYLGNDDGERITQTMTRQNALDLIF